MTSQHPRSTVSLGKENSVLGGIASSGGIKITTKAHAADFILWRCMIQG